MYLKQIHSTPKPKIITLHIQ
uniref:Uncharacterized protein n=1 Tax=Anguilla anguilla TaxID=7936 RepID=A0A0E9VP53_ANGAN